jgi:SAM-dependent methyltransferase
MDFANEAELKTFILEKGCFDQAENERIYAKFFQPTIREMTNLRRFVDFNRKKVLEIGACYGHYLVHFPSGSTGVDLDARAVEFARGLGLSAIVADVDEPVALEDGSFDIVHCHNVLEHVTAPHRVLREFYRLLSVGGRVLIGGPNMDAVGYAGWRAKDHLYAYNYKSLAFLLERAGFRVTSAFINGGPITGFLKTMIFRVAAYRIGASFYMVAEKDPGFRSSRERIDAA